MYPLLDSQVFELLRGREEHLLFGRQRMWGTIGQAVITIVNGVGIGKLGWDALFGSVIGCSCLFLTIAHFGLPSDGGKEVDRQCNSEQGKQATEVVDPVPPTSLLSFSFVFFLCTALIFGFGRAVLGNFLPTFLSHTLGHSPILIGFTLSFRILTELTVFTFNRQLITSLGWEGCLSLARWHLPCVPFCTRS